MSGEYLSLQTLTAIYQRSIEEQIRASLTSPLYRHLASKAAELPPLHGPDRKYHDQPRLDEFYEKFSALVAEYGVEFINGAYAEDHAEFRLGHCYKEITNE